MRNRLIQQRQGVAQTALRATRDQRQCAGIESHLLCFQHVRQTRRDLLLGYLLQIELQAARQYSHRNLLRIGGG
jgi:hypothetical protein